MNSRSKRTPIEEADQGGRFQAAAEQLSDLMNSGSLVTSPYASADLPYFCGLDDIGRDHALERIETMVTVCLDSLAKGAKITDNAALVECFLKYRDYTSVDSLFELLEEDDSVEVYNTSHRVLFTSVGTLSAVSYTLEELYCRKWTELLSRDVMGVHESLFKLAEEVLAGKHHDIISTQYIPDHVCREPKSVEKRSFIIFPRFFAPIYQMGKIAGYLCANKLFPYDEPPIFHP